MDITQFLEALCRERGAIVSSNDCSEIEIVYARACNRFYVDSNGLGYVLRTQAWRCAAENSFKDCAL